MQDHDEETWTWITIALAVDEETQPSIIWKVIVGSFLAMALALGVYVQCADASPFDLKGKVVGVSDGDTLTLLVGREQHRIRLAGIDAPEQRQAFGDRAKQALSDLCFGDTAARVRIEDRDRYGRAVGRVTCRGNDANAAMVEQGYAWVYTRYNRDRALPALETSARAAGRGLWADAAPIPPWEFRGPSRP